MNYRRGKKFYFFLIAKISVTAPTEDIVFYFHKPRIIARCIFKNNKLKYEKDIQYKIIFVLFFEFL